MRMEHDGDAPNLTSVSAVGIGIMDAELERQRSAANLSDVASIVYTSGTTGKPKGCEITHGNFVLVARNIMPFLPELLMQQGARTLMFLPLAHVLARAVQVVCLSAGDHAGSQCRCRPADGRTWPLSSPLSCSRCRASLKRSTPVPATRPP